jgi:hypothetical protein
MVAVTALALGASVTPAPASPVVIHIDSWDGNASPLPICFPTPLDEPGHEFIVGSYGPGTLHVEADWEELPFFLDDLDLYIDRLENGEWTSLEGDVGNGNLSDAPDSRAAVELLDPPAGTYRARVVNCISLVTAYHAEVWFQTTG